MTHRLTRRDFIKLGATSLVAASVGSGFRDFPPGGDPTLMRSPTYTLGRVIYSMRYYEQPSASSTELGFYNRDAVVDILAEAIGDPEPTHNPIWLRTNDGWLHSAYVQPVADRLNEPVLKIPNGGMLAEVTVPFTQAYRLKDQVRKRAYRCYYASTYWVHYAYKTDFGVIWYQIWDDLSEDFLLVEGAHLRPITAEEVEPVSPGRTDKRIEIDLVRQRLTAYQGRQPVFTARTATGYFDGDTPKGEYRVERKQPSRHMASNLQGNEFDLPGVPWVCYISWTGVSFHGTYWHNNYGTPQSHGCINLNPQAARWIYRWTDPVVPINDDYVESDQGTPVTVF